MRRRPLSFLFSAQKAPNDYATADSVLDYRLHGEQLVSWIKDLELDLVDGMGHMPQFVEPKRVEALIRRVAAKVFGAPANSFAG